MEELFINRTKCTNKEYLKFLNSYNKEYAMSELLNIFYYVFFLSICIVLAIINKEIKLIFVLIVIFILLIYYKFVFLPNKRKKQEKSDRLLKEYTNTYIFYKHFFKTITPEGEAQTFYLKIYKVIETKTNFYIYIDRDFAFILLKDGFKNNECDKFKKFLIKKVMFKYKKQK